MPRVGLWLIGTRKLRPLPFSTQLTISLSLTGVTRTAVCVRHNLHSSGFYSDIDIDNAEALYAVEVRDAVVELDDKIDNPKTASGAQPLINHIEYLSF